jgi:hypothetical protein
MQVESSSCRDAEVMQNADEEHKQVHADAEVAGAVAGAGAGAVAGAGGSGAGAEVQHCRGGAVAE